MGEKDCKVRDKLSLLTEEVYKSESSKKDLFLITEPSQLSPSCTYSLGEAVFLLMMSMILMQ